MENKPKKVRVPGFLIYLLIFAIILLTVQLLSDDTTAVTPTVKYSALLEYVEQDLKGEGQSIAAVTIRNNVLYARANSETTATNYDFKCVLPSEEQFYLDVNAIYANVLQRSVSPTEYQFEITTEPVDDDNWLLDWLPIIISVLFFVFFIFSFSRAKGGNGGGMTTFGRSRARVIDPKSGKKVLFKDVAGADEEKEELKEIVDFLKDPAKYTELGAKIPTGVLLVGPPGTGKTLLARAVAGEAGVPFFSISGSDFVEMFVGVGASRVRDLFEQAKKSAPAIVFIDEIDAVGRQRGTGLGGGHDEREQTLNQLLVEMDGFTQTQNIIVMAATNRADVLDPALLRPGRFDRRITVGYPDVIGREAILRIHAANKPLAADVDLHKLALSTPYHTGADLMNIMNEAALLAARRNQKEINAATIHEATTRVMMGPEKKSKRVTEMDRKLVAYHEGGHAIVAYFIPECDKVREITTIPRGDAGGYTMYLPQDDFHFVTSSRLNAQMASAMGGRVAEALVFGDISTGASQDIKQATEIARGMVTEYGMSDKLGPVFLGTDHEVFLGKSFTQQSSSLSDKLSNDIDNEVHRLLQSAYDRAEKILTDHRDKLDGLAKILIEKEKLDEAEFDAFMKAE